MTSLAILGALIVIIALLGGVALGVNLLDRNDRRKKLNSRLNKK